MYRSRFQKAINLLIALLLLGDSAALAYGGTFANASREKTVAASQQRSTEGRTPRDRQASGLNEVSITDAGFVPQEITVTVGDEVTWINDGTVAHGVSSLIADSGSTVYLPLIVKSGSTNDESASVIESRSNSEPFGRTTATTSGWASGLLHPGQSFSRAFNQVGTFEYQSTVDPDVTGTVIVEPANQAPSISINTPVEGAVVGVGNLSVSGNVSDDGQVVEVVVNGVPAVLSGDGFEATIPLESGNQTILAEVTDDDGATGFDTVIVAVDGDGPSIEIASPRHRQSVYSSQPFLDIYYSDFGNVVDTGSLQATLTQVGEGPVDISGDLTIGPDRAYGSVASPLIEDSTYTFTVSLDDSLGNNSLASVVFYVPVDADNIIAPTERGGDGWVSGVVYDSSTCDRELTTCTGLAGAQVTLEEVVVEAVAQLRTQRQNQTLARLSNADTFEPLGPSTAVSLTVPVTGTTITGPDGFFAFPAAKTGVYWLRIEKEGFTYGQRELQLVRERSSTANDIYLTPLDPVVTPCDTGGCSHTNSDSTLKLEIPAGAIANGESVDVTATTFDNVEFLPSGELPEGTWETYAFNLGGASEITFTVPVTVQVKNTLAFSPGLTVPLGYWNQNTQSWEHAGSGVVDPSGEWIETTVTHFSNYDHNFPVILSDLEVDVGGDEFDPEDERDLPGDEEDEPCGAGAGGCFINFKSGTLHEWVDTPSVSVLGEAVGQQLSYSSDRANPSEVIDVRVSVKSSGSIQSYGYMGYELFIQGEKTARHTIPANLAVQGELGRLRYYWDGRNAQGDLLPPGAYQYQVKLTFPYLAEYCQPIGGIFGNEPDCIFGGTGQFVRAEKTVWRDGTVTLHGDPDNPFGAGWALGGMQRLYETEAGDVLIVDGQRHDEFYFPQKDQLREAQALLEGDPTVSNLTAETEQEEFETAKADRRQEGAIEPVGGNHEAAQTVLPTPNQTPYSQELSRVEGYGPTMNMCGAINSDTTWTAANITYVLTCDVSVQPGVTLTIEPDVTVQFQPDLSLAIEGSLVAIGLEGSPITFESAGTQVPASWKQIAFLPGSSGILDYVVVKHGGYDPSSTAQYGAVTIASSDVVVSNSTLQGNGVAVYVGNGAKPTISNSSFISNTAFYGGAIYAYQATLTIEGGEFGNNQASRRGGAIYAIDANLDIRGSSFFSNATTSGYGGALAVDWHATANLIDNHFEDNRSNGGGGGAIFIYNELKATTIVSNTFLNNLADNRAGGAIYDESHQTTIKNNTFVGNQGRSGGAVAHLDFFETQNSAVIEGNIFRDGQARGGGGIYIGNGDPIIRNNIFANNVAEDGGGLVIYGETTIIEHNVFWNNKAEFGGGITNYAYKAIPNINNNIIVSNTATFDNGNYLGGGGIFHGSSPVNISLGDHNLIWNNSGLDYQEAVPGPNDISQDPLFVDPANLDFHLQSGSPAINAGGSSDHVFQDYEGDLRPMGLAPDIGADEYLAFGVAKQASASLVTPGDPLTYTIQVVNVDNGATVASLTDELPEEFTFVSYESPAFTCIHDGAAWGGIFSCDGSMGPDSQETITVTVMADAEPAKPSYSTNVITATNGSDLAQDNSNVWLSWCAAQLNDGPILDDVQETIDSSHSNDSSEVIKVSGRCFIPGGISTFGRTLQGGWNRDFSIRFPGLYTTTLDAQYNGTVVALSGGATLEGFVVTQGADSGVSAFGNSVVQNNIIEHNYESGINTGGSATIRNNTIRDNIATAGGGIYSRTEDRTHLIDGNLIYNNASTGDGGGIYSDWGGWVRNNIVLNNEAEDDGGGLYYDAFKTAARAVRVEHNTFFGNSAGARGGGLGLASNFGWHPDTIIRNNAVISNTAPDGGGIFLTSPMNGLDYNNVWGNSTNDYNAGTTVPANDLSADPLFVDPAAADFHLTAGSPMIDAADPLTEFYPDFEGDPRPMGDGGSDIGADEYPAPTAFSRTATDYSRLEYDPPSNTYTRYYLDGTIVYFDAENRHDYTLDPDGKRASYSYNGDGTVASVSITAPGEASPHWNWTFSYANGKLASITDPAGRMTSFTVDENNHLTAVTLPDGASQTFTYNEKSLLRQHRDENGDVTDYQYDDYGRLNRVVDPVREVYDPQTGASSLVREVRTITPSDTSYPLLNSRAPGTPDSPGLAVPRSVNLVDRIEFGRGEISGRTDRWGFWASQTDGLDRTTRTIRNLDGTIRKEIYPDGDCVEYTYDESGNTLSEARMAYDQCILAPNARDASQVRSWSWTYEDRFNQIKSETDPNGYTTETTYDYEVGAGDAGRVVRITYPEVDDGSGNMDHPVERFSYNSWGLLETEVDPMGTVTRYVYSQGTAEEASGGANPLFAPGVTPVPGLLTQVIRDYGGENLTDSYKEFDAAGNPGLMVGPGGHNTTAYVYDEMNRVVQTTDAVGVVTTYAYDGRGNLVQQVVDAGGRDVTTTYDYDAADQLIRQQVDDGSLIFETSFKYDINQQPVHMEDGRGNETVYIYDDADQLINVIDPAGYVMTYTYTLDGQRATMVDADGYSRQYEYDAFNQMITEIADASGLALTSEFTYDLNGNLLTTTDPTGTSTCFSYDALNRHTARTLDCGGESLTTENALDLNGNILRKTDHRGVVTRYEYDALNRQTNSFLDAGGLNLEFRFSYDAAGNLAETRDMRGTVTQLSFDELNRVTQQCEDIHGLNLCSQFTYDSLGNQETAVDPNGIVTLTTFNGFGRPIEIVEDAGGLEATTAYSYDNNLNTASITDANGNGTHYAYTSRNELAEERFADGTVVVYSYNGRGLGNTRTNQDGTTISHDYDGAGRMTGKTFSDGGVQQATYDGAGRITSASQTMDGHTTLLARNYNGLGHVISETQLVDGQSWSLTYDRDYASGTYTLTYPSGTQTVHTTDHLERVEAIRNHLGQTIVDYDYDDVAGQRSLSYFNGVATQVDVDSLNRTTRIQSAVADYQYGYDGRGNRTFLMRGHLAGQPADVYEYDGLYRPVQVWYGADATDPGSINSYDRQQSFDLDLLANRLQVNDDGTSIDYNPSDGQQLANTMNRYESVDGRTYTYDLRGNTLSDGVITYTYDILNRQIGIDGLSNDAEYVFNAFGYRVATIVNGTTTYFVYDNQGQVLEERDGDDQLLARYTYGPGIDIPVTMERGASTYYYHRDAQNSITEITDESGNLVERYEYGIYGAVVIYDAVDDVLSSSAIGNPYLYTGRRFDAESGNYYFRARVYSAELGRFLQMDPVGYVDGMNLYASYFVINGVDPSGTVSLSEVFSNLKAGFPDINVSAGVSIEAKSPPVIGPLGVFIKLETKFTLGTCCEKGKTKTFLQHDFAVTGGVHFGVPGVKVSPAIKATFTQGNCPKEGPLSCQGVLTANVTLLGLVKGSCSVKIKFDLSWTWSCGLGVAGTGEESGFGYGSSGFTQDFQSGSDLFDTSKPELSSKLEKDLGISVGGGIECSKLKYI